eukprot:6471244-Amphidinium_carterae.1
MKGSLIGPTLSSPRIHHSRRAESICSEHAHALNKKTTAARELGCTEKRFSDASTAHDRARRNLHYKKSTTPHWCVSVLPWQFAIYRPLPDN